MSGSAATFGSISLTHALCPSLTSQLVVSIAVVGCSTFLYNREPPPKPKDPNARSLLTDRDEPGSSMTPPTGSAADNALPSAADEASVEMEIAAAAECKEPTGGAARGPIRTVA